MTVRIRLEAADVAALDAHEAALRSVLTIPAPGSRDYANRPGRRGARAGDEHTEPARRRYLESTGVRTAAADEPSPLAAAEDAKQRRDILGEIGALRAADEDLQRRPWFPLQPGDVVLMHLAADAHSPAYGETYLAVDGDTDIAGNAMLREVSRTRDDTSQNAEGEPEFRLRYDTSTPCWVLDTYQLDSVDADRGRLQRDYDAPASIGSADVKGAQSWAEGRIARLLKVAGNDDDYVTGWYEHSGGWAPVFNDRWPHIAGEPEPTPFYDLWFEAGPGRLTVIRAGAVVHGRPAGAAGVRGA